MNIKKVIKSLSISAVLVAATLFLMLASGTVSAPREASASATTVASQMHKLNRRYDGHDGIAYLKFNRRQNHLTIYLTSQKHHQVHFYHGEQLPMTAQANHAVKLGNHLRNTAHDKSMATYFCTATAFQRYCSVIARVF